MIDRAGLTASGQPEITWRENDLLARGATAEVVLPASPDAAFHVKSVRSPARMAVQLLDAQSGTAEVVGGRVVYPGGYARGDVVHQLRDSGTEDFVVVRERGATSLDYDLVLEQGLAGLRLGPNVLELLDARGAPRLRVGTPYVVDDAGSRVAATLSVEGCAYDTSPAAPWGRPVTPPGAGSCRVHVAWNDVGLRYPLIVDPAWTTTHNLIQDRDGLGATLLASGLVLLSGGVSWTPTMPYGPTCYSTYQYSSELFDPSTQTFAYTGNPVTEHFEHRSVTLTSGKAVVAGAKQGQSFNTTEMYDPTAGTWSNAMPPMEGDRMHPALAPLPSGGAMLLGGRDNLYSVLKTTQIYTPGTGWAAGPPMTTARQDFDAVALGDGSILVVAGTDEVGSPVPTSERYVPGVGWDAPVSLVYSAGTSYRATARLGNGKFLLAIPNGPLLGMGSQIYDPATKAWSGIAATSAYNAKTAALGNGQVLVLGSATLTTSSAPVAQIYDAVTGWQSATLPTLARYPTDDTLTALATGDALIAGGVLVGGCASTKDAEVYMLCPPWTVTPATLPAASVNGAYSQMISSTGAVGAVTYALSSGSLPSGITLANSGTLSGTPTVGGTFPITVKATDSTGCATPKRYSLVVSCPTITVLPATATLPYGRGGTPYDQTIGSTGGIGTVAYGVTSGALPPGVTLTSDGTLSGTPTAANNFSFTITATDTATTCTGSQTYTLPIYCPSFTFSPSSPLPDGMAGTPYPTTMVVAGGALGATTYYVDNYGGALPPGMTLGNDGTLSGTPTQSGTFVWLVTASDSSMCMHTAMFQLTIDPNPEAGAPDAGSADAAGSDAGSPGPDAGSPDSGAGGGGNDAGAIMEAGTDAATAGDGGPSGNDAWTSTGTDAAAGGDAGSGTGVDAAAGTDSTTGTDAAVTTSSADGAVTGPGADAAAVLGVDGQAGADTGAETEVIDLGDGSNALTEGSVAPGSGDDSGATGTNVGDGSAPVADSGSPAQEDGATESDATNGDASPEGTLVRNSAGCSCRESRQTGSSWWPLAGIAMVFMAARRRASRQGSTRGRMR